MNYRQTIQYLYRRLPMFTRIGPSAYKEGIGNIALLMQCLQHPEKKFKCIHVAGTNGKGSTSHMLAAIFQKAGYKTGLFTSPHLFDFRERIRVNGIPIKQKEVVAFVAQMQAQLEQMAASFFEVNVAMAFDYFAKQKVDIAIVETGLGGRLDSTNVVHPELSLITNIGLDHTELLGPTLSAIAMEKAGIIKQGVPVIIGQRHAETQQAFQTVAQKNNAGIRFADAEYTCTAQQWSFEPEGLLQNLSFKHHKSRELKQILLPLTGTYQRDNVRLVLSACDLLKQQGWPISDEHILDGLAQTPLLTGLRGRFEYHAAPKPCVFDTGHNAHGLQEVMSSLRQVPHQHLHIVFGVVRDKQLVEVWPLLPKEASYYFVKARLPRAMPASELQKEALRHGLIGKAYRSVRKGWEAAYLRASEKDLIYTGGSTFVVAEALKHWDLQYGQESLHAQA